MKVLRLVPDVTNFKFVKYRRFSYPLSAVLSIATLVLFMTVGLNFGIDFKGGTLMELQARSGTADIGAVRQIAATFGEGEPEVQEFGSAGGLSVRVPIQPGGEMAQAEVVAKARAALEQAYEFRRVETVGPRVSGELVQSGTIGVLLAVIAVLAYLWFRFEPQLAVGAIIGTLHDIVLTIFFFLVTQIEFNMTSIAAILTIIGYSLNETVVVFDRTRELLRRYKTMPMVELLDLSVNSTISRTVMTATTTFLSLLALVIFGGPAIEGFALVMLAGIVICTYSAMYISSPVLIYLGIHGEFGRADAPTASAAAAKPAVRVDAPAS